MTTLSQTEGGGKREPTITPEQMEEIRKRIQAIVQEKMYQQVLDLAKATNVEKMAKPPVNDSAGRITERDLDFGRQLEREWKDSWSSRPDYILSNTQRIGRVGTPSKTGSLRDTFKEARGPEPKKPSLIKRLAARLHKNRKKPPVAVVEPSKDTPSDNQP